MCGVHEVVGHACLLGWTLAFTLELDEGHRCWHSLKQQQLCGCKLSLLHGAAGLHASVMVFVSRYRLACRWLMQAPC